MLRAKALKGKIIVIEGVDYSSRRALGSVLSDWIKEHLHIQVVTTEDPLRTSLSAAITTNINKLTAEYVLQVRREYVETHILPALKDGAVVICDGLMSTLNSYQEGVHGFDLSALTAAHYEFGLPRPYFSFLVVLSPTTAEIRQVFALDCLSDTYTNQQRKELQSNHLRYFKTLQRAKLLNGGISPLTNLVTMLKCLELR
jgi:thymidylate kinase